MEPLDAMTRSVAIGVGATAVMDLWLLALKHSGVPTLDFALLGRWVGHVFHGQVAHDAIRRARPIAGELGLGWLTHYAVGIVFAGLLVVLQGAAWLDDPAVLPALAWGLATAAVPLFLLQPAMGAGIASSRTAAPLTNSLRSLANHAVFGLGLYLSAAALARWAA
jgi:Protein of unknown function (DUF2938)